MTPVLVVDDDEDIRQTLRFILDDAGYDVSDAPNGQTALHMLRAANEPVVVLVDLLMPGLTGAQLLETMRDDGGANRHRFIVMTAASHPQVQVHAPLFTALGIPVLTKPLVVDALLDTVAVAAAHLPAGGDNRSSSSPA